MGGGVEPRQRRREHPHGRLLVPRELDSDREDVYAPEVREVVCELPVHGVGGAEVKEDLQGGRIKAVTPRGPRAQHGSSLHLCLIRYFLPPHSVCFL